LFGAEAIDKETFDTIWNNCSQNDDFYTAFLSLIIEIVDGLENQLTVLIEKLSAKAPKSLTRDELELMSLLVSKKDNDDAVLLVNKSNVLRFFWDYLSRDGSSEYLNTQMTEKAVKSMVSILTS
jgi:hypothetical protein